MTDPDRRWKKLVDASRQESSKRATWDPVPPGFTSRILGLRNAVQTFARALAWRRWSVVVAAVCGLAFLAVFAVVRCSEPEEPLIAPPELNPPQP